MNRNMERMDVWTKQVQTEVEITVRKQNTQSENNQKQIKFKISV